MKLISIFPFLPGLIDRKVNTISGKSLAESSRFFLATGGFLNDETDQSACSIFPPYLQTVLLSTKKRRRNKLNYNTPV